MNGEEHSGEEQQQAGTQPQAPAPPSQDSSVLAQSERDEGRHHKKPPSYHLPTRPIEWLQVGLNAVLALIAIGALCVYHSQLGAMKGQQSVMQGQVDEMRAEQRAFVSVADVSLHATISEGQPAWGFAIDWINSGKQPTYRLHIHNACPTRDQPAADPWNLKTDLSGDAKRFLGPGQHQLGGTCTFKAVDVRKMQNGEVHLYMASRVEYWDRSNKDGPPYVTEFCIEVGDIEGNPLSSEGKLTMEGFPCKSHNCADEDCKNQ